jgi:hypothetical protein
VKRRAIAGAFTLMLLLPGVAAAEVLPTSYARQATRAVAKRLYHSTRDAERFGVARCRRRDDRRLHCRGFVKGHSLDPNGAIQAWRCEFSVDYTLTRQSGSDYQGMRVRAEFSPARCSGPGAPYIQRPG